MADYIFLPEDNVDEASCISAFDNSIDFYLLVLNSFVKESAKILNHMRRFASSNDMEQYRMTVHGLKSSAASVGFLDLSAHAKESEQCCKALDWSGALTRDDVLRKELENAVGLINTRVMQRQERLKSE